MVSLAMLLGASGLVKETSALSFAAVPWISRTEKFNIRHFAVSALILFLPLTLWLIYVHVHLPSGLSAGHRNFNLPFFGIAHKLWGAARGLAAAGAGASIFKQATLLSEIISPLSLFFQAAYLAAKPRFSSEAWRFGIGFVILLALLGENVWADQYAYCRVLLTLTFSFNILIHEHEYGGSFVAWYLAGNVGMCGMALRALL